MNLVFLHGLFGSAEDWAAILPWFSKYKVTTLTLPGHGPHPEILKNYTIQSLSDWVFKKVDMPSHFIGYSLGGRVLLNLYKDHPQLFKTLTLESTSPGIQNPFDKNERARLDRLKKIHEPRDFFSNWYKQPLFFSLQNQPELLNQIIDTRIEMYNTELEKVLKDSSPGLNPDNWNILSSLKKSLFIAGQLDSKYSDLSQSIVAQNPSIKVETIENVGHCVHRENPQKFAEILLEFLESN